MFCFQVPINDTNTQFVEQTIAIMKNLLDNHTEGSSEHLGQASIETMMLNLVRSVLPYLPHRLVTVLSKPRSHLYLFYVHYINSEKFDFKDFCLCDFGDFGL